MVQSRRKFRSGSSIRGTSPGRSKHLSLAQLAARERAVVKKKVTIPLVRINPETVKAVEAEVRDAIKDFGKSFAKLKLEKGQGKPVVLSQSGIAQALLRGHRVTAIRTTEALVVILRGMEKKGLLKLPLVQKKRKSKKKA